MARSTRATASSEGQQSFSTSSPVISSSRTTGIIYQPEDVSSIPYATLPNYPSIRPEPTPPSLKTKMGIASSVISSSSKVSPFSFKKYSKMHLKDFVHQKEIGRGGFSQVLCVLNKRTQGYYALKKTSIVGALKRCGNLNFLITEIECLKAIGSHPFIVNLQYAFHDYQDCYLILDLIPGGDLRYQIDRKFLFHEPDLALIALSLGSALQHIHQHNVLHRDIKPENIVIDRHGIPYLTDFGISYCGTTPEPGELLVCNLPSGTKPYMAPEMLTRSRLHGTAADYWALGITLFELCYGTRPFKSLPFKYLQYARRCHYYEWYNACSDSIVGGDDDEYEDDERIIETILKEAPIQTSDLFHDFMMQLLDVRIPSRLGGRDCQNIYFCHPWLTSHLSHWTDKISILQSIKKNTQASSSSSSSSGSSKSLLSSTEDRDMVMTSEWFSERYLSCRKVVSQSPSTTNQQNVDEVSDIRKTSFYSKEIEEMLSLYDYEATSTLGEGLALDILQLIHRTHKTSTTNEDTTAGRAITQLRKEIKFQLSGESLMEHVANENVVQIAAD